MSIGRLITMHMYMHGAEYILLALLKMLKTVQRMQQRKKFSPVIGVKDLFVCL